MTRLPKSGDGVEVPTSLFFCAMAACQLGNRAEAESFLQQGIREFVTRISGPEGPSIANYRPDRWLCWGQSLGREWPG